MALVKDKGKKRPREIFGAKNGLCNIFSMKIDKPLSPIILYVNLGHPNVHM